MQQEQIHDLRKLVHQMLAERGVATTGADDESLFIGGRLDSMAAVDLIMQLEQKFGVDFSRLDFDVSLIDSVDAMAGLLQLRAVAVTR
jgi:acyl carrier protein